MQRMFMAVALTAVATVVGCAKATPENGSADDVAVSAERAKYLASVEPAGALPVIAAREQAQDDDEVVVVGRIGGSANPWIEDRAAFSIVDPSLKACSDIEGDNCPMPWDYCCETDKLPGATALVKVVNAQGELVGRDARELLDLAELQTVVVQGKAERDEAGNLTILASRIYVRPGGEGRAAQAGGSGDAHDHDHEHGHDHKHAEGEDAHEASGSEATGASAKTSDKANGDE